MNFKSILWLTAGMILLPFIILIPYDAWVYINTGNFGTLSAVAWNAEYGSAAIVAMSSILFAHLVLQRRAPSSISIDYPAWIGYGQIFWFVTVIGWVFWDQGLHLYNGTYSPITNWVWSHTGHDTLFVSIPFQIVGMIWFEMHEETLPQLGVR